MPRNKAAKRLVKKRLTPKGNKLAFLQEIEQDFMQVPANLAMQLQKEISALKLKETKLKNVISKFKNQIKASESRIKAADKLKNTSSGKKRLAAIKKNRQIILKTHAETNKELQEMMALIQTTANKQAKFLAISKQLNQFEKDWAKKLKKNKAMSKTKSKKTSRKTASSLPALDESKKLEPAQSIVDHVTLDETAELTS